MAIRSSNSALNRELIVDAGPPGSTAMRYAKAAYVVSARGEYAHIPRSARVMPDREYAITWCSVRVDTHSPLRGKWVDDPGDRPICGTCLGRDVGADPTVDDVKFAPRSQTVLSGRRWCPSKRMDAGIRSGGHVLCVICGHVNRGHSLKAHAPASKTATVCCPSCGWKNLSAAGNIVQCRTFGCEFNVVVDFAVPPPVIVITPNDGTVRIPTPKYDYESAFSPAPEDLDDDLWGWKIERTGTWKDDPNVEDNENRVD